LILDRFPDLIENGFDKEQADPHLIGFALHESGCVVTEETPLSAQAMKDPKRKAKIKIPNVCHHYENEYHYEIQCMKAADFINSPGWR